MGDAIRILIADDHPIVLRGLRSLLRSKPGIQLVGEATNGEEAVRLALELKPDLILMDLMMPRKTGLEALEIIRMEWPDAHVLILTSFIDDDMVIKTIKAGALGVLQKDAPPNDLLRAIQDVQQGNTWIPANLARKVLEKPAPTKTEDNNREELTEREMEVLLLMAQGMTNKEVAQKLVMSEATARFHISNILTKLNLSNRTQAVLHAIRSGWIKVDQ